jgi:hypothetical protein
MTEVNIPFRPRFKEPMLSGQKTMTSRTKKMAGMGDTFSAFGATFVVVERYATSLSIISHNYWREEGCTSEADFVNVWNEIHPRKGYDPQQIVWCHLFRRVK